MEFILEEFSKSYERRMMFNIKKPRGSKCSLTIFEVYFAVHNWRACSKYA